MKWNNPAHEYDDAYLRYSSILKECGNRFCVFGAGIVGKKCMELFCYEEWDLIAVVDNNPEKWGKIIEEKQIISFEEYRRNYSDCFLILCISEKVISQIIEQVSCSDLEEGKDFCTYRTFLTEFIPVVHLYRDNRLHMDVVELAVTERCTLKCKKCAHGCAQVPLTQEDICLDVVKESADRYFEIVDEVNEFYLIGGETLLYKELPEAIRHIGKEYRDKIHKFIITTNGTMIPSEQVLEYARKYHVIFYISNYSMQIPQLKQKYQELCNLFEENQIEYYLNSEEMFWMDYGFDYVDHGFEYCVVEKIHDECFTPCREIRGSRYYYCIQARSVSENMNFTVDSHDYLELTELPISNQKKLLYEYSRGYCWKGYIDMCNYCNGSNSRDYIIPAAEQIVDEE